MDLSGLIFVVLALAWAGYLIPRALRQHDDLELSAPVDTSSDTARVLNRTPAMMRALLADAAPVDPARKAADREALKDSERHHRAALTRARPASRGAAVRRRRILLLLVALTGLAAGLAGLSLLGWWAVVTTGALVVAWLVLCVLMARRARLAVRRSARHRSSYDESAEQACDAYDAGEVPADGPVPAVPASPVVEQLVADVHDDVEAGVVQAELAAEPELDAAQGALWDPLPLTLPTYVGKATARRTVRTIELTRTGVTSSGHDAADSALARQAAEAEQGVQRTAQQVRAAADDAAGESERARVRRAAGA